MENNADDKICMFYVVDRLKDFSKIKSQQKLKKEIAVFAEELIFNLGINSILKHEEK